MLPIGKKHIHHEEKRTTETESVEDTETILIVLPTHSKVTTSSNCMQRCWRVVVESCGLLEEKKLNAEIH